MTSTPDNGKEQDRIVTDGGWPTGRGGTARTGYIGGGRPEAEPKKPPWKATAIRESPPAIAYGGIFTATSDDTVCAYDIETGDQLWECDVGGNFQSANVVAAEGMIFGGDMDGMLFGIDAETGDIEWTFEPDDDRQLEVRAKPTVEGGTVYAPVRGNGMLYALDGDTGEEQWAYECEARYVECTPVAYDGWVYLGDGDGNFYAINPEYEIDEWTFEEYYADFNTAPAAADGTIVANADDDLYAFDAESGEELWRSTNSHEGSPTIVDGTVYAGIGDGIVGYDLDTGEEEVTYEVDAYSTYAPAYAEGVLYAASDDDTIEAFDAESGDHFWTFEMDSSVDTSVVVAEGAVFAMDMDTGQELKALTEGADDIEAEVTVAEMDVRGGGADEEADEEADTDAEADADDDTEADDQQPAVSGPTTADGEWPTAKGPQTRTSYAGGGRPESEPKKPPWKADSIHEASPAVAHGAVFTATRDDTVRAYDIETGEPFWEYETDGHLQDTNVVATDGMVFGGDHDGTVFALDAETGDEEWTFQPDVDRTIEVKAEPTVDDGTVYIMIQGSGSLYALDAETGAQQWAFESEGVYTRCTPVVYDEWVYFGDDDGNFYAVNPEYEVDEWSYDEYGLDFSFAPAAADGLIFANADDDLYAFDAEDGEKLWRSTNFHDGAPVVANGLVYAGTNDGIVGYDPETGEEVVTYETDSRTNYSPAYADGIIYVTTDDGTVEAFDVESEDHLWTYEMDDKAGSGPVVADGAVFVTQRSYGDDLLALTEGADDIEADASIGSFDARSGEAIEVDDGEETSEQFLNLATEQIEDEDDPTDDELQAVILGLICDEWITGDRVVRLNSNTLEEEISELVAGATGGLVYHNLERLAEKGCIGWENKNQYHLVKSRPESIHLYEEYTGERVIEEVELMDVLDPLYEQTRNHPREPAVTREALQEETYLEDDELDRIVWYLDNIGKWIKDALIVKGSIGYVDTRAMSSGTFWHEAELNEAGKEFYEALSE